MDLEDWRKSKGLAYRDLAELIGEQNPTHARRYALGENWPREERLAVILARCDGVDLFAMHQRRLAWVRANRRPPLDDIPAAGPQPCDGVPTAESRP